MIIKDTRGEDDQAVKAIRQLSDANVAAVIGPLLTVAAAGREAEKLGLPLIALTQKNGFALQGDYLFSNFITPEMQAKTLGEYLFGQIGLKKVAILYPNEKYGRTYMNLFWDVVDDYGATVVGVEAYDGSQTDFAEAIQKLTGEFFDIPRHLKDQPAPEDSLNKTDKPPIDFQALFIPDSPSRVSLILPQLVFNDATGMYLVGTNLWHHDSLLKDTRGYNRHTIISDGFFDGSSNPETQGFVEKFESLYGKRPGFLEAIGYDTTGLIFKAAAG